MNSDLMLVRLFMQGLRLLGVPDDDIRLRVSIHETANEQAARWWWAQQLGWSPEAFQRSTIKRNVPRTVRKNVGDTYHGCLTVSVVKSRRLYQLLDGIVVAVADGADAVDLSGTMGGAAEAV